MSVIPKRNAILLLYVSSDGVILFDAGLVPTDEINGVAEVPPPTAMSVARPLLFVEENTVAGEFRVTRTVSINDADNVARS